MITSLSIASGPSHDIQSIDNLLEGFQGIAPADKGFIDAYRHSLLLDRHKILVVTPQSEKYEGSGSTLMDGVSFDAVPTGGYSANH